MSRHQTSHISLSSNRNGQNVSNAMHNLLLKYLARKTHKCHHTNHNLYHSNHKQRPWKWTSVLHADKMATPKNWCYSLCVRYFKNNINCTSTAVDWLQMTVRPKPTHYVQEWDIKPCSLIETTTPLCKELCKEFHCATLKEVQDETG